MSLCILNKRRNTWNRITLDARFIDQLIGLREVAEFCDANGNVIGTFEPVLNDVQAGSTQGRLYVVESERPIFPDLALVRTAARNRAPATNTAVLELDSPAVFELYREEVQESVLTIIEPAADNRIVTAIEVLSPTNKVPG